MAADGDAWSSTTHYRHQFTGATEMVGHLTRSRVQAAPTTGLASSWVSVRLLPGPWSSRTRPMSREVVTSWNGR